jgi:hypothetical protein
MYWGGDVTLTIVDESLGFLRLRECLGGEGGQDEGSSARQICGGESKGREAGDIKREVIGTNAIGAARRSFSRFLVMGAPILILFSF